MKGAAIIQEYARVEQPLLRTYDDLKSDNIDFACSWSFAREFFAPIWIERVIIC
jgi:hypothetical protein